MTKQKKITFYMLLAVVAIEVFIIINRCFYGIETTDEAYYIANANLILQGKAPMSSIWTLQSGSLVIYTWLLGLYKIIFPNFSGVFLYLRICFTIFRLAILIYGFFSLRKIISNIPALCACAVLVPHYGLINQFSYVTCAEILLILTGIFAFNAAYNEKKAAIYWGLSGITVALAICSHPSMIINALFMLIVCLILSKKRLHNFICVAIGGLGTAVIIMIWIIFQGGGIDNLLFSLNHILTAPSQNEKTNKLTAIVATIGTLKYEILSWLFFGIVSVIIAFTIIIIKKTCIIKTLRQCMTIGILTWIASEIFFQVYQQIKYNLDGEGFNIRLGAWVGIASITLFLISKKDRLNITAFLVMCCPSLIFAISNGMFTGGGLYGRLGSIIPASTGFIILLIHALEELDLPVVISYGFGAAAFLTGSLFILNYDYTYVYRDNPIPELNYVVKDGIYKGIYTTQVNAESLPEIENVIRNYTANCNTVKSMDCAPEVYLMTDALALTPTTWDDMQYANGKNDPTVVYQYFEFMKNTPDAIIYVASPSKPSPSIFQENYLFNQFVNKSYEQTFYKSYGNLDYELVIYMRK